MRAIIIDDKDAKALLDKLELTAMRSQCLVRDQSKPPTVDEIHRAFVHVVVCWLQEQGADVVGR